MPREPFDLTLAKECARAFSAACGVGCVVADAASRVYYESGYSCASCRLCSLAGRGPDDCAEAHIYGMTEAERFGGKYIYFCPMGLTCFVSPILGDARIEAQITVGPFLMVEPQDYIACDLEEQQHLSGPALEAVKEELKKLPYIPTDKVTELSTLLFMAVGFMNNVSAANRMLEVQESDSIQGQITAYIQHLKCSSEPEPYPFETEQALLNAVRHTNKDAAHQYLNELFGHILFSSGGDLQAAKTRIYELLVLISRTAITAGANPEQTLQANQRYLVELTGMRDFDALCVWLVRVANALMDSIFRFADIRHASVIHQSIQYLNTHYSEKITMEEMARRVYLSPAYFSRIFNEETGVSFRTYLNRIRVDHSKELLRRKNLRLADIAGLVGFEDQSYFTKVFKKLTGVTPVKYRGAHS